MIYLIFNTISGKGYVGKTVKSPQERLSEHNSGMGGAPYLYRAIKKYGAQNFVIQQLEENSNEDDNLLEKKWIKKLGTLAPGGYNLQGGGQGGVPSSLTRMKLSAAQKRVPHGEEWVRKVADANRGKRRTAAFCKRLSLALTGRPKTKEFSSRVSATMKGRAPWNRGKILTPEHRAKISASLVGNSNAKPKLERS